MTNTPRIYAACLSSYNSGILYGEWIDAVDVDAIREGISEMLAKSPTSGAEEWAIHDYEGFEGMNLGEYADLARVAEIGALIEEHGRAFAAYAGHVGEDYADGSNFEDANAGEWPSEEAFAEELFHESFEVPDNLAPYIDYEKFARDLFCGDYFSIDNPEGGVFVFRNV